MMLPIDLPQNIVCVGLNYRDHAGEQGSELPKVLPSPVTRRS